MPRARTGTVYQHGDHLDVRVTMNDGKRSPPFHMPPGMTREVAIERAAELSKLAREGKLRLKASESNETVATWFARWFADRERRGLVSTEKDRGRFKKWVTPTLGAIPMVDVTPEHLEDLVEDLDDAAMAYAQAEQANETPTAATMLAWKSARNVWALVRKGFGDASGAKTRALRVIKIDPSKDVHPPDKGGTKARSFLSPSRFLAFVRRDSVPLEWRRTVALAVYLYARASELRGLTWDAIQIGDGYVSIHRTVDDGGTAGTTKTDQPRLVPLEPALAPLLRALKAENDDRVFELPDDRHLARGLRRWLTTARLDEGDLTRSATRAALTWHDLRATGITWRAIRGDDPMKISRAAGHANFSTTQKYIRAAEILRAGFGEVFPPLPRELFESSGEASGSNGGGSRTPTNQAKAAVGEVGFESPTDGLAAVVPHTSAADGDDEGRRKYAMAGHADDSLAIPRALRPPLRRADDRVRRLIWETYQIATGALDKSDDERRRIAEDRLRELAGMVAGRVA